MTVHHETKLYGGEANVARPFGIPGLLIGARAIYFGEKFPPPRWMTLTTLRRGLGSTDDLRDHATIRTDNRLVGLQLGLQHMFDVGDVMRIGGSIKGGLYNNFVDRNRTFVSENRLDLRSFESTDHENVFAQGVEFNPRGRVQACRRDVPHRLGAVPVAEQRQHGAPELRLDRILDSDHNVRANDDVYFYGGSLGLTILLDQSSPISNSLTPFAPDFRFRYADRGPRGYRGAYRRARGDDRKKGNK